MSPELEAAEASIRRKAQEMPWNDPKDQRPFASRLLDYIFTEKARADQQANRRIQAERQRNRR